ncbi:MAG TPA: hypothetical protein VGK74_10085 [Symbiobacteriaceae bacterium]|jgi:hypothetical protein
MGSQTLVTLFVAALSPGLGWWGTKYESGAGAMIKIRALGWFLALCGAVLVILVAKEWIQALLH